MKTNIPSLILVSMLAGVAFLQPAQAVVPPPDGGYPGFNTAEGSNALQHVTSGVGNTANGWRSLFANTAGSLNTAIGAGTLLLNTGDNNTATGGLALLSNTAGSDNTAAGSEALYNNETGSVNTAFGVNALHDNTIGQANSAVGSQALYQSTGSNNTAIGSGAGFDLVTGNGNVYVGDQVRGQNGESNTTYIRNVYDSITTTRQVYVDANNKIGTLASTRRVKDDIEPMASVSETILALRPVTFHYKKEIDRYCTPQFGLVAEEVSEINPDLVTRDREGKPETVRYDAVNAMLLNEFQKEHETVQELKANAAKQDATIALQQKQIEALTAGLQKVSAQLEVNKAAPQVVVNRPLDAVARNR